jgi:hypothetical protein
LQACKQSEDLLVQLLPLFSYSKDRRAEYGSSVPTPQGSASPTTLAGDLGGDETGYWDLMHILYPELLERLGAALLREVVSSWPTLERALEVSFPDDSSLDDSTPIDSVLLVPGWSFP